MLPEGWTVHHLAAWHKNEFAGDRWAGGHPAYTWEPVVWAARAGAQVRYHGPRGGRAGRDLIIARSSRHDRSAAGHPCPKPERVVRALVAWSAPPGGLVLDPFGGSGTAARACKDLGRRCILIEAEEAYCEIAARRLAQEVLPLAEDG